MSDVRPDLDLAGLSRKSPTLEAPRRSWLRIVLPLGILLVFAIVLFTSLGDLFDRGILVQRITPRVALDGGGAAVPADRVVVQAAGWVEPDPFLIHVPALAGGVVEEVLVQESDVLEAGDAVARLVDEDSRLARDKAMAERDRAAAVLAEAEARDTIATERFVAGIEVTEAEAVAHAAHTGTVAAAEKADAAVAGGVAQVGLAEDELVVQQELAALGAAGTRQVELAQGALDAAESAVAVLEANAALAAAEAEQAAARHTRTKEDLRLRFDDRLERDRAAAALDGAKAGLALAQAALGVVQLELDRMIVRTPVGGVVLERLTVPGMVLDLATTGHEVCSLYDPKSLRVRVDVPQDDIESLFVGQRTEVLANARPGRPYTGTVLRIVQLADIQKVTLEAQVRIDDGDGLIRPDMLAQVRFFGSGVAGHSTTNAGGVLLLPAHLVEGDAVWVLDPEAGTATRRSVTIGGQRDRDVEILEGLNPTDKVLDPGAATLTEGAHVRFEGTSL